jgi:aminoglycoside phosphotransferase family enzyme/predicted kinase
MLAVPDHSKPVPQIGQGGGSQSEAITFLSNGANLGDGPPVEIIQTHGAYVFLAGSSAYKIKRAVRYDYLDFSTLEKRRDMLLRELELNAPSAPQIYRDVIALTRDDRGRLRLGDQGTPVEWVLRMNRFESDKQLDRIAMDGALTDALAVALGEAVADYHRVAPPRAKADGPALINAILDELNTAFASMSDALGSESIAQFRVASGQSMPHLTRLLRQRTRAGHVRRFHGDLHLRNIALIEGRPVLFDALEFDETLGTGDVLYDLAFLVMDLLHRSLPKAANLLLNAYLFRAASPDHDEGLAALPLFLSIRAAIRAMVNVQTARFVQDAQAQLSEARAYLAMATTMLAPASARLIAIGGVSGTGKSTLAASLAPHLGRTPGAVHLRSDLERKALFGVTPTTRLPRDAYREDISHRVYALMTQRAEHILKAGHSVILDATYLTEADRAALAALAERAGTHLEGLWLEAPAPTLMTRVAARKNDASDADAAVVESQIADLVPPLFWTRIDASGDPEATLRAASDALSGAAG